MNTTIKRLRNEYDKLKCECDSYEAVKQELNKEL